ncbi:S8 family serine peptidase, partial [Streptomyces mirabilis]
MTDTCLSAGLSRGARRLAAPVAALLVLLPLAGGADADSAKLPVMPAKLASTATTCTRASPATVNSAPWTQQNLDLAKAHQFGEGAGVTVAVVDTGVAPQAGPLARRVTASGAAAQDCVGHGTFVAGLIAAAQDTNSGFSGTAPRARILAERGTDELGAPSAALVAAGIRAAADSGAEVVYVSAAFPEETAALKSAVAYAQSREALLVAPAAPDGTDDTASAGATGAPAPFWPASAPGVLSVEDVDIDGLRPQDAFVP